MKLFNKKTPTVNNPTPIKEDPNKRDFTSGLVTTKDIIAPSSLEVDFNHIRIDNKYYRTLFVAAYPRFVGINWLSSLINFDSSLNISMFIWKRGVG
jgi:conjugal transfer ATP-binding protein TraC